MEMGKRPDRERWSGWVAFAWLLAFLTILASVYILFEFGEVEVPVNRYGSISWETQPNFVIWGVAIGQSVASVMLAVIFSMLNAVYQNTCDQIVFEVTDSEREKGDVERNEPEITVSAAVKMAGEPGLFITKVESRSPLFDQIYVGDHLVEANGRQVDSFSKLRSAIFCGKNFLRVKGANNKYVDFEVDVDSTSHLGFEALELPASEFPTR